MITKKRVILVSLLSCVLGLTGIASQKNPVERPLKALDQYQIVFNLDDGTYMAKGSGHVTHGGNFTSHLEGEWIWIDEVPVAITGLGTITMANGDQLLFESQPDGSDAITGGTGRFDGASGSTTTQMVGDPIVTIGEDTITMEATGRTEGTVSY
jgi:hypothetical protein